MTQTGGRRIPIRARIEPGYGKEGNRSTYKARIEEGVRPEKGRVSEGLFRRRVGVPGGTGRWFVSGFL